MNSGVHPLVPIAALGVVLAIGAVVVACLVQRVAMKALLIVATLVFLLPAAFVALHFHPELIDGRFRTYKGFFGDIQIGMSREEVFSVLDHRYPATGKRGRPKVMEDEPARLGFFMNPEDSQEPNCEGIFLTLEQGRVVGKDYCAD